MGRATSPKLYTPRAKTRIGNFHIRNSGDLYRCLASIVINK